MVGNDSSHFEGLWTWSHLPFSRRRPSLDLYYTLLEILKETREKLVLHQPQ